MGSMLTEAFVAAWPGPGQPPGGLAADLEAAVAAARAAHPEVVIRELDFVGLLAERAAGPPQVAIADLRADDLWLALACARGNAAALRSLELQTFDGARGVLRRMGLHAADIDEVLQIVRERLLVAPPGERASILSVGGRGDLRGLIRVAAARTALNLRRKDHRIELGDERLFEALTDHTDSPALAAQKVELRAAFKAAVQEAVLALEPWQRNVLRLHLIHALSIDEIGDAYHVHRATAARWLNAVRARIHDGARQRLVEKLRLSDGELAGLFAAIESRLNVSFDRLLATQAPQTET